MATSLDAYIYFTDTARQALEFYREVFGGTLTLTTFGEYGTDMAPATHTDLIMHGSLETEGGLTIMASDMGQRPGPGIAMSLSGDDTAELTGYWDTLSDGAEVETPLEKQMWGDTYGKCVDRFGVTWTVNIAGG